MYFGGRKSGPRKQEELKRNKEHAHFSDVGGRALLLKQRKRVSSFDPVVKGYLCYGLRTGQVQWKSHSTPGKET